MIYIPICVLVSQGLFAKRYGGSDFDHGYSIAQAQDGGYAVVGPARSWGAGNYDILVMKTDASGNLQWAKTFGGPNSDQGNGIIRSSDGGFIVCGCWNTSATASTDILLFKLDASGTLLWAKQMGGSNEDRAHSVIATSDGGYALAGVTSSYGAGGQDFIIVKTDASGSVTWARTFGGGGSDGAWSVAQTSDGGYLVGGSAMSFGAGASDMMVIKLDNAGNLLWAKALGGTSYDHVFSVGQAADGNYLVAGRSTSFYPDTEEYMVVKLSPSGDPIWARICGRGSGAPALSMTPTDDGGCAITSRTSSSVLFVAKLDASGDLQWAKRGPGSDGWGIVQTPDRGFVVSGYIFAGGANDAIILRLDANGNYPGCVNDYSPVFRSEALTVADAAGLLTCNPPSWTPSWTITSPTPAVADVCAPLETEETDGLPGSAVISSPTTGGALFICQNAVEIEIYSVDGRLAHMGRLQPGANRVSLNRAVYLWKAGAYRGKVVVR